MVAMFIVNNIMMRT